MAIVFNEIATVKNSVDNRMDANWGNIVSEIHLDSEFHGAFKGIEDFSHVIVIYHLHQAKFDKSKHLQRRPRNLEEFPLLGIFSQRGKNRPNPIGITAVKVVECKDNILKVIGLDAVNNTPVLDIKPYYPHYDRKEDVSVPMWVEELMKGYFN